MSGADWAPNNFILADAHVCRQGAVFAVFVWVACMNVGLNPL